MKYRHKSEIWQVITIPTLFCMVFFWTWPALNAIHTQDVHSFMQPPFPLLHVPSHRFPQYTAKPSRLCTSLSLLQLDFLDSSSWFLKEVR